jgi:hypothetical protein
MMRFIPRTFLLASALVHSALSAQQSPSTTDVISRARATLGSEQALNEVITLKMLGTLEPANAKVPAATLLIIARKPNSQRLEIRMDDMVETTILNCRKACIIRSNLGAEASQMRELTEPERERVLYSTRQLFNFYQPNFKSGEKVTYEGMVTHREKRTHKISYKYPEGLETVRYFSVEDDTLVASVADNGVESVNRGSLMVQGIKFPESIDYYEEGRKLHTIKLREVSVNKPLAAGIFDVPIAPEK